MAKINPSRQQLRIWNVTIAMGSCKGHFHEKEPPLSQKSWKTPTHFMEQSDRKTFGKS